jgi:hypothetical protein
MHVRTLTAAFLPFLVSLACAATGVLAGDTARFTKSGELLFPADYRQWVFLSSGLGMTYGTASRRPDNGPRFTNVFVNPSSHKEFLKTGRWPEGTMFVLEIRESSSEGSINKGGHFQAKIAAVELEVKDSKRFPGGWAYFDFASTPQASVPALGPKATCPACHSTNGAVEHTFVQFYPSLIEVARAKGTLKAGH